MSASWSYARIGDVLKTGAGGTPLKAKKEYYEGGNIPWLLSGEVAQGEINRAENFITQAGLDNSSAKIFPPNTVLVAMYGATAGQVGLLRFLSATNQAVCGILPDSRYDPKFVFYALLSKKDELIGKASGNAQPNISQIKIRDTLIPVLPLDQQRRIVAVLDKALDAIATATANAKKNVGSARELFDCYLGSVFNNANAGTRDAKLRDVCREITVGHVGSMAKEYKSSGVPFLRSQNIRPFEVSLQNITYIGDAFHAALKKSKLAPGDLAIVRTGYPGTAAVIPESLPEANCSDLVIIRPSTVVDAHYLAAFFNSTFGKSLVGGRLVGSAQKHFNVTAAKDVVLHLPSIDDQRAIVRSISEWRRMTEKLDQFYASKIEMLTDLKAGILAKAFSGELTVDDIVETGGDGVIASTPQFGASVLALAYERHRSASREETFGHVKAQKTLHLVEAVAGIDMGRFPIKDAAGPNDFQHMLRVEKWAEDNRFFKFRKQDGRYRFERLSEYKRRLAEAEKELAPFSRKISSVISLLVPEDTKTAEVIATVYAAWNNLILDNLPISDEAIVKAARDDWHDDKLDISRKRFFDAIKLLKRNDVLPTGSAKRVGQKTLL